MTRSKAKINTNIHPFWFLCKMEKNEYWFACSKQI